jgi:MFS family permease
LLLGLTWGSNSVFAWNAPQVIGVLAGAGALYILFVVNERFAPEPIVPLNLFRNQIFTVTALLSLLQLMILVGLVIYLPLYLQGVLGVSASNSGVVITPMTLASVVGSGVAGVVMARSKRYRFVAISGAVVLLVGTLLLTQLTTTTPVGLLAIFMVIGGLGLGTFFGLLALAAQNSLPRAQLGVGTAAVRYMGQVGGVLGVAIIGAVVNGALSNDLAPRLARIPNISAMPGSVVSAATNPQVLVNSDYRMGLVQGVLQHTPPQYQSAAASTLHQIFDALKQSLTVAIVDGILVTVGLCMLMVILTLMLRDKPLEASGGEGGWA